MQDQTRNLNPHAEALLHSYIWGEAYANQGGGVMDFWDKADDTTKKHIRELMDQLVSTRREGSL